ncbi:MAG TPA: DUF4440 domain-containing protein [Micromonosporaceae bacterium]|nr:DUF4440 domain-containing protein [Micromonosporaceae bacterium]HCU51898.1 DUF4440 domain-containing protein [Micromonosporaceae bacterium]
MGQARDVMDRLTAEMLDAHNVESAASLYADNAAVMTPDAGEIRGRTQIANYWKQFVDGFPDSKYEPISKIEAGNKAVDEGYFIGTHTGAIKTPSGETLPPTGKRVKLRSCDIATVENGKITEHHLYFDEMEFNRQLGLAE